VIFGGGGGFVVFDGMESRTFPLSRSPYQVAADEAGKIIAFSTGEGAGSEIVRFDPSTGAGATLVSAPEGAWEPSLTADGAWLLFVSRANFAARNDHLRAQAFLMRTDASDLKQVTRPEDDITSAVISGAGNVAYAATQANQLLRIDLQTGAVEELVSLTPELAHPPTARAGYVDPLAPPVASGAPGSLIFLKGANLSPLERSADALPLPRELAGVRVLINGAAVPLVSVAPDQIVAQVPWESSTSERLALRVETPNSSPLEGIETTLGVTERLIGFVVAAHDDFRSLVTESSPARPGEIIHVYMTGLGSVDTPLRTGEPAPTSPPAMLTGSIACSVGTNGPGGPYSTEVLFAGLAPGLVGLYQIDLRLPEIVPPGSLWNLGCRTARDIGGGAIPVR
jgi:uncharacterized protein (TIGR03437 family)